MPAAHRAQLGLPMRRPRNHIGRRQPMARSMNMSNHGIDYGMGTTNVDTDTGIHYGVIPMSDLHDWAREDFEDDYGPPSCPDCGGEVTDDVPDDAPDQEGEYWCPTCRGFYDDVWSEEPTSATYQGDDYTAQEDSSGDVWVLKSLYYTHARFCSPCAPGACYLMNPVDTDGPKAYCFGHDWFNGGVAPYTVYRVADGSIVNPEEETDNA